jgi:hypothetical protein
MSTSAGRAFYEFYLQPHEPDRTAGVSLNRRTRNLNSAPSGWSRSPPRPKQLPCRHQPLNGARARQPVPFHLACFISPAIFLCNVVWAEQGQTAPLLFQFLSIERTIKSIERTIKLCRVRPAGHPTHSTIIRLLFAHQCEGANIFHAGRPSLGIKKGGSQTEALAVSALNSRKIRAVLLVALIARLLRSA